MRAHEEFIADDNVLQMKTQDQTLCVCVFAKRRKGSTSNRGVARHEKATPARRQEVPSGRSAGQREVGGEGYPPTPSAKFEFRVCNLMLVLH